MTAVAVEFPLVALLERAGATLRSRNRADCPRCGGKRTISHTDEVFYCHHAGCESAGTAFTLAKELGLAPERSADKRRQSAQLRRRAQEKAGLVCQRVKTRRWKLYDTHQNLLTIWTNAREALRENPENSTARAGLAFAQSKLDEVRAGLLLLENGPFPDVLAFLNAPPAEQKGRLRAIMQTSGLLSRHGKFLECDAAMPGGGV
jgi:ribosomal protein L37AE/L43A